MEAPKFGKIFLLGTVILIGAGYSGNFVPIDSGTNIQSAKPCGVGEFESNGHSLVVSHKKNRLTITITSTTILGDTIRAASDCKN